MHNAHSSHPSMKFGMQQDFLNNPSGGKPRQGLWALWKQCRFLQSETTDSFSRLNFPREFEVFFRWWPVIYRDFSLQKVRGAFFPLTSPSMSDQWPPKGFSRTQVSHNFHNPFMSLHLRRPNHSLRKPHGLRPWIQAARPSQESAPHRRCECGYLGRSGKNIANICQLCGFNHSWFTH